MKNSVIAWIAGATALVSAAGMGAASIATTDVTLVVDGHSTSLRVDSATVNTLLAQRDIAVGEHDEVTPAPATQLTDGMTITVQYGRQFDITIDGVSQTKWAVGTTVGGVLDDLGLTDPDNDVSPLRTTPVTGDGVAIVVNTPKLATVTVDGQSMTTESTLNSVGALLSAQGITLGPDDRVTPDTTTALTDGIQIMVQRVTTTQETTTVDVPFTTTQIKSSTVASGQTKVQTPGVDGSTSQVWSVTSVDGVEESRTLLSETVVSEPVTQVELVGTKVAAAPRTTTPTVPAGNAASAISNTGNTTSSSVVAQIKAANAGNAIIQLLANQVGKAYVYGATGPNAFDCSGLVYYVYHTNFGYNIPRTAAAQGKAGTAVSWSNIQPGDLIWSSGHVGVYVGNGLMIHAATPSQGVIVSSAAAYQARGYQVSRLG